MTTAALLCARASTCQASRAGVQSLNPLDGVAVLNIRPVAPEDDTDISVIVVSAFGQPNEYNLIKQLREDGDVAIELVAETDGAVVGHICLSRLQGPANWLALAPVSVGGSSQNMGFGSELIRYALDAARRAKFDAVVVVGDPDYYSRFGFVFNGPSELVSPYPEQYLGLFPIAAGSAMAQARLVYPRAFDQV